jgi:hypothetical protein
MHDDTKTRDSGATSEGVKEAALASFLRTFLPEWVPSPTSRELIAAIARRGSLARLTFDLGRKYELHDQARRLIAARARINGVQSTSMIVDDLAREVAAGVSHG